MSERDPHLDALLDRRIPGGCADCGAYQTVDRHRDGVYVAVVHHDDTCPWLAARQAKHP